MLGLPGQQGHSVGLVGPICVYLGGFLSDDSVFLLICFAGTVLMKDQFLQLVEDPAVAPHFVGWLSENGVFSCKSLIFFRRVACVFLNIGVKLHCTEYKLFIFSYCTVCLHAPTCFQ